MLGSHLLKSWSATQKNITLSSGEAELVAAVKMGSELIGITQLAADWGMQLAGKIFVDSSAAIGTAQRRGNGKLRHVRVGDLWIQEKVEEGELQLTKVWGEENPADAMTKNVSGDKLRKFVQKCSQGYFAGRADESLQLKLATLRLLSLVGQHNVRLAEGVVSRSFETLADDELLRMIRSDPILSEPRSGGVQGIRVIRSNYQGYQSST